MATIHVQDASLRRTSIKVLPSHLLSDVLNEVCAKKGLDSAVWTLKTQAGKPLDLSQPFRLSGLSAGAKLQLVQASRSAGVVNVAVQFTEGVDAGPSGRMTDKFPSTTSLWQVLRKFEDGVAGNKAGRKLNITQRGIPSTSGAGSGRLVYEQPTVVVENRTLEGFAELQKTLAGLGYREGSVLLRVGWRRTEKPLEEAMAEISVFFEKEAGAKNTGQDAVMKDVDGGEAADEEEEPPDAEGATPTPQQQPEQTSDGVPSSSQTLQNDDEPPAASPQPQSSDPTSSQPPNTNRISVYAPPTSSTPAAALAPDDPALFEPTIDHAKALQASLGKRGQNQRLKSDKELEEIAATKSQELAAVQNVRVRVQYPSQHTIETTVPASATGAELYTIVRDTLRGQGDGFELRYFGPKGRMETVPSSPAVRLVRDLGFRGGVKVTLAAAADASASVREGLGLKAEYLQQAQELKVELQSQQAEAEEAQKPAAPAKPDGKGKGKGGDVEAKMKRLLGFGRK